jgi:hypothetical protein
VNCWILAIPFDYHIAKQGRNQDYVSKTPPPRLPTPDLPFRVSNGFFYGSSENLRGKRGEIQIKPPTAPNQVEVKVSSQNNSKMRSGESGKTGGNEG